MAHLNFYNDEKKLPERAYFFSIIGTLIPEYLSHLITLSNRLRSNNELKGSSDKKIEVD